MSEPAVSGQPLFYSAIEPLDQQRHASLGLKRTGTTFGFAAEAHCVPLTTPEFNLAQKTYPIIFSSVSDPRPLAALAVQQQSNLFLQQDGSWLPGVYIPAYVRRYPFIFARMNETEDRYALCVDRKADMLSDTPDLPFFQDGELSETGKRAVEFCQNFQGQVTTTEAMMTDLAASNLLAERDLTVTRADGSEQRVGNYIAVSEEKLGKLEDADFLKLRHNNLLPFIYMHLASLSNWSRLLDMHVRRQTLTPVGPQAAAQANGPAQPAS